MTSYNSVKTGTGYESAQNRSSSVTVGLEGQTTGFVCAGVSYKCKWQVKVNMVLNVHRNRRLVRDGGGVVEVEVW